MNLPNENNVTVIEVCREFRQALLQGGRDHVVIVMDEFGNGAVAHPEKIADRDAMLKMTANWIDSIIRT